MVGHQNGFAIGSEGKSHGIFADREHLLLAVRIRNVDHVDQPLRQIADQEFRTVRREARLERGFRISLQRNRYGHRICGGIDEQDLRLRMIHGHHVLPIR